MVKDPNYWRKLFVEFFQSKGCRKIDSDSLVPANDPSLLFTGAGMNQFKDDFTGNLHHNTKRATTTQKCIRLPDLENVGKTARHHTFFEMLGFFSFGDFFKKEAIEWLWEFYTSKAWCDLPIDKLRVSVYKEDDEAYELWAAMVPHLHERGWIYRMDEHDNFWPAGCISQGPNTICGPCSEVFYDLGESYNLPELKDKDTPENNDQRFMELGNIVFTQYQRSGPVPGQGVLTALPQKNIDFGGGFERLIMVLEGATTTLDSSLFMPIRTKLRKLVIQDQNALTSYQRFCSGGSQELEGEDLIREKRIADHIRAAVFIIADGVSPSNEKQGYVLRRILRRAYRDGTKLGFQGPFLHQLVEEVVELYGDVPDYHNIKAHQALIHQSILQEQNDFARVLSKGIARLEEEFAALRENDQNVLAGEKAFELHSTYGLPIDITKDFVEEEGFELDEEGFKRAFKNFRATSRLTSRFSKEIFDRGWLTQLKKQASSTLFLGYEKDMLEAKLVAIRFQDELVENLEEGQEAVLILEQTPFYAEAGGQVGDQGLITTHQGARFEVADTKVREGYYLHLGKLVEGKLSLGDQINAHVDQARRSFIRKNHSATHLLHAALRQVLGEHVHQKGSSVDDKGLRFDFSHPARLSLEEQQVIEQHVNTWVAENYPVETITTTPSEAREAGALMFFGEKYGQEVRMLQMGINEKTVSCELCGGTHVQHTGDIGLIKIVAESSVASGVRRIEALTGLLALEYVQKQQALIYDLTSKLKTSPDQLPERLEALQKDLKKAQQARKQPSQVLPTSQKFEEVAGKKILVKSLDNMAMSELLKLKDQVMKEPDLVALILAGKQEPKINVLIALSPEFVERGGDAVHILNEVFTLLGGRGGGRKDLAQGGGKHIQKLGEALDKGKKALFQEVKTLFSD